MGVVLLDHRYSVSSLLCAGAHPRRFAGCHVGLDAPVRIVELRPLDQPRAARAGDATQCAAFVARAAALRHPVLPRMRDCFYAHGACYVVEDALEDERLAARLARRGEPDLRAALRDGLLLCDAVARIARDAPELLACLLIASTTLAYDASGTLHLTTWDYSRWLDGQSTLVPGAPELRAPEVVTGAASAPDERAHVYSIAALLAILLAGDAQPSAASVSASRAADLPAAVQAALAPALHADPCLRTPDADALGRALARAARATLLALEHVPAAPVASVPPRHPTRYEQSASHPMPALAARPWTRPVLQPAIWAAELAWITAPRALRRAGERSRAAVVAALHRAGWAPSGSRGA